MRRTKRESQGILSCKTPEKQAMPKKKVSFRLELGKITARQENMVPVGGAFSERTYIIKSEQNLKTQRSHKKTSQFLSRLALVQQKANSMRLELELTKNPAG